MAATDYERDGKNVLVIYTPTDEDYERRIKVAQRELESECILKKSSITIKEDPFWNLPRGVKDSPYGRQQVRKWNQQSDARAFVESFCNPIVEVIIDRDAMVRRDNRYTRRCEEERETNQFICEERRTGKNEMTTDQWAKLKTYYTYFRY